MFCQTYSGTCFGFDVHKMEQVLYNDLKFSSHLENFTKINIKFIIINIFAFLSNYWNLVYVFLLLFEYLYTCFFFNGSQMIGFFIY